MKLLKISIILLPFVFFNQIIQAQDSKNSTKVSYAYSTMDQYFKFKSNTLPETYQRTDIKSKGAIFIAFSHILTDRISSGATIGSTKITSSLKQNNQLVGILNRYLYTIAIETDFSYLKWQNSQLYAVAAYGYSLGRDEYFTDTGETGEGFIGFMAFQVSPIAFKYGKRVSVFAELGFGYKGIINLGFRYGF